MPSNAVRFNGRDIYIRRDIAIDAAKGNNHRIDFRVKVRSVNTSATLLLLEEKSFNKYVAHIMKNPCEQKYNTIAISGKTIQSLLDAQDLYGDNAFCLVEPLFYDKNLFELSITYPKRLKPDHYDIFKIMVEMK